MRMSDSFQRLGRAAGWIPAPLRRAARRAAEEFVFRRAMRRLVALAPGALPSRRLLAALRFGWANGWYAAHVDYLAEVARLAEATRGPVLECGSGLTTLLLGVLAGRRGVETWALEHSPLWHARVSAAVRRYELPGVHLCLAPLADRGRFEWYDAPLAEMPRAFPLVVCDGPPGDTRGGRYGLIPVLGTRLPADALVLLDDAHRPGERETLRRWEQEADFRATLRETPTGTFALVKKT